MRGEESRMNDDFVSQVERALAQIPRELLAERVAGAIRTAWGGFVGDGRGPDDSPGLRRALRALAGGEPGRDT